MTKPVGVDRQVIARNKKAHFNYVIEERLEAGISLYGAEVKALRDGIANLVDGYALPKKGELFLLNCRIGPYKSVAAQFASEPTRARKLLLHRRELDALITKVDERGYSLIPLDIYFKEGKAKLTLALCRGKTHEDRRDDIKERETNREIDRAMKSRR